MKYDVALERIANCYYNLGLERARLRDLNGAAELLKKALLFDRYQKDARNLLGLIYFECGETADALVQWVISMNLLPDNNIADYYLDEIQRKPAILRICSDNVKRYNQALDYAQHNNEDLATMQLNQVISDSPNYIKAHILLALLYMKNGNWVKAGRSLYKVLKIDRNNPKALVLMDEVKKNTGRAEVEQSRLRNAFSHRQMTDDDVLLPQEVKRMSPWVLLMYILGGTVFGIVVFYLLIIPARIKAVNVQNNQELIFYTEKLDQANSQITALSQDTQTLQEQLDDANQKLSSYENQNASFMNQYQTLQQIQAALGGGDLMTAASQYLALDGASITDQSLLASYNGIKAQMEGRIYQTLASLGTSAWNSGNLTQALRYYQVSTQLHDDPGNDYMMARLYQLTGDTQNANAIYDRIVGEHPESAYAERARAARGY